MYEVNIEKGKIRNTGNLPGSDKPPVFIVYQLIHGCLSE